MPLPIEMAGQDEWGASPPSTPLPGQGLEQQVLDLERRLEEQNNCFWHHARRQDERNSILLERLHETEAELQAAQARMAVGDRAVGMVAHCQSACVDLKKRLEKAEAELGRGQMELREQQQELKETREEQQKRVDQAQRRALQIEGKAGFLEAEAHKRGQETVQSEVKLLDVTRQLEEARREKASLQKRLEAEAVRGRKACEARQQSEAALEELRRLFATSQDELQQHRDYQFSCERHAAESSEASAEAQRLTAELEELVQQKEGESVARLAEEQRLHLEALASNQAAQSFKAEAREAQRKCQVLETRLKEDQGRLSEVQSAAAAAASIQSASKDETRRLEQELAELHKQYANQKSDLSRLARSVTTKDEAVRKAETEKTEAQTSSMKLLDSLQRTEMRLGEVSEEVVRSTSAAERYEKEAAGAQKEAAEARSRAGNAEARLGEAESALAKAEDSYHNQQSDSAEALKQVEAELEKASTASSRVAELESLVAEAQGKFEEEACVAQQLNRCSEEVRRRMRNETDEARLQSKHLQDLLAGAESRLSERAAADTRAAGERDRMLQEAQRTVANAEARVSEANDQVAKYQSEAQAAQATATSLPEVKAEAAAAWNEISKLESRVQQQYQQIRQQEADAERKVQRLEQLEDSTAQASRSAEALRQCEVKLEDSERRLQRRTTKLRNLEEEADALRCGRAMDARELIELRAYAALGSSAKNAADRIEKQRAMAEDLENMQHQNQSMTRQMVSASRSVSKSIHSDLEAHVSMDRARSVGSLPAYREVSHKAGKVLPQSTSKSKLPQLSNSCKEIANGQYQLLGRGGFSKE